MDFIEYRPEMVARIVAESPRAKSTETLPLVEAKFTHLKEGEDYGVEAENFRTIGPDPREFVVFYDPYGGEEKILVEPPHFRSATFPDQKTEYRTEAGVVLPYYCINAKGIGYLKPPMTGAPRRSYRKQSFAKDSTSWNQESKSRVLGMMGEWEDRSITATTSLIDAGLRAELPLLSASLLRIPFKGEMRSIEDLREQGVFGEDEGSYYVLVRALKNNDRVEQPYQDKARAEEFFQRAFELFDREQQDTGLEGRVAGRNFELYFNSFAERLGKNCGILRAKGLRHGFLHPANISMAAEFCDMHTLQVPDNEQEYEGDAYEAYQAAVILTGAAHRTGYAVPPIPDLLKGFLRGYKTELEKVMTKEEADRCLADIQPEIESMTDYFYTAAQ